MLFLLSHPIEWPKWFTNDLYYFIQRTHNGWLHEKKKTISPAKDHKIQTKWYRVWLDHCNIDGNVNLYRRILFINRPNINALYCQNKLSFRCRVLFRCIVFFFFRSLFIRLPSFLNTNIYKFEFESEYHIVSLTLTFVLYLSRPCLGSRFDFCSLPDRVRRQFDKISHLAQMQHITNWFHYSQRKIKRNQLLWSGKSW